MCKIITILLVFLVTPSHSFAEINKSLQNELLEMGNKDQKVREPLIKSGLDNNNLSKELVEKMVAVDIAGSEVIIKPIQDKANVDKRRKEMGMPPLDDYIKMFKKVYGVKDQPVMSPSKG